jgi:hypothetical protein
LRAFHGLNQQLLKLEIALPWWPLLKYVVGEALIEEARALRLPEAKSGISKAPITKSACKLCVRITENGKETVALDLSAEAALELDQIMPRRCCRNCFRMQVLIFTG